MAEIRKHLSTPESETLTEFLQTDKKRKGKGRGRWIQLGHIPVDSGRIRIADPCYWDVRGFRLTVQGFGGDGIYPVEAHQDADGRITSIIIRLDYGGQPASFTPNVELENQEPEL